MPSEKGHIIIVGGGAAGLWASLLLLKQGYPTTILEASNRLGGRIRTVHAPFSQAVEKGVEFIHGNLPLTIQLLKQAKVEYVPVEGKMIRIVNGEWKAQDDFTVGWRELMEKMNEIREDTTIAKFLEKNFSDKKYDELRDSVLRFAQGFDLADPSKASVLSLREEWMSEEDEQFRVRGGCDQLVNYLEQECLKHGGRILCATPVTNIYWQQRDVRTTTADGREFRSQKTIVTPSLGMLLRKTSTINFNPAINDYIAAAKRIGFGSVVKVTLEFKKAFWDEKKKNIGFLFTQEIIPTWWTQFPSTYPLLTGWAGGPQAWALEDKNEETILELALQSLSNVFELSVDKLKTLLTASLVSNWSKEPFIKGAYSYGMIGSATARKRFVEPIDDSIYFAGEAFYEGPSPGTVEAALVSAKNVVERIIMNNE